MKRALTFGVYDMLHKGHISLLTRAKQLCDELIVCVSTDDYVMQKKHHWPVVPFESRKIVVSSLFMVDRVDSQSLSFGKAEAVEKYKPDFLVVGDDWTPETYGGEGLGVPVKYLSYTKDISSSMLRERVC